jgi:hypothetical protein
MKYNLVLEIINDPQKFDTLKSIIPSFVNEINEITKNGKRPTAKNNETWKQTINYYAEFVEELEKYRNLLHKSKNYKPKGFIRTFENLRKNEKFDNWLDEIGYKGNYKEAAEIAHIIYKFFTSEGYAKSKLDQATTALLNKSNERLRILLNSQPSVKTK